MSLDFVSTGLQLLTTEEISSYLLDYVIILYVCSDQPDVPSLTDDIPTAAL